MEKIEKYIQVLLSVSGMVQGVGFRYWTRARAGSMGLGGYVRNLPSGQVEVMLEGEEKTVDEMISLLRRGPSSSFVEKLTVVSRRRISSRCPVFEILR